MNHTKKRRFIAGAVCPRCSSMDTIMMFQDEGVDIRQCVECDFEEKAHFDSQNVSSKESVSTSAIEKELPTRVNKELLEANSKKESTLLDKKNDLQIVKIIGNVSPKKN
ncbi:MAG: YheV family putative metal-binding protein [Cellvibrionaceae bacterium]